MKKHKMSIKGQFLRKTDKFVVGGLHREDFEWVAQQYEEIGYILVAFLLDCDGYHWKAVYVKALEGKGHG